MFCNIVNKTQKRSPDPSYRVFKHIYLDAHEDVSYEFPIARKPQFKLQVYLNSSSRVDGKPKKKQWYITTICYWDIIDSNFFNIGTDLKELIKNKLRDLFDEECVESHYQMIAAKLNPIAKQVFNEYRSSEEYRWLTNEEEMKQQAKDKSNQENDQRNKKRDSHTNDGYRNNSYSKNHSKYESKSSQNQALQLQKELREEIVKIGYRTLSKKYHPDTGGDTRKMQELGSARDHLKSLACR